MRDFSAIAACALFGAAFLLAACGKQPPEAKAPPEPDLPRGVLAHVEPQRWTHVYLVELNGTRCAILAVSSETAGGISCDWNRPPIYGDVEQPERTGYVNCSTDSDCAHLYGDGSPVPLRRF